MAVKIKFYHNYNPDEPKAQFLFRDSPVRHFDNLRWKNLVVVNDCNYDFLVCFNDYPEGVDKNKCIVIDIEPPISDYFSSRSDCFYKTNRSSEQIGWVIHLGLGYNDLNSNLGIRKNKEISTVSSDLMMYREHVVRREFISKLSEEVPMDIYGRGVNPLPIDKKYLGLFDYKYHIQSENFIFDFHSTEKLADSILAENLCFYYGAPNVSEIYNSRAFVEIDMTDYKESFRIIKDHMRLNSWKDRINYIIEEKRRILNDLQLAPKLHKIINGS